MIKIKYVKFIDKFKPDDVVDYCGEQFVVIKNFGSYGVVQENCKDGAIINNAYWNYLGEKFTLIKNGIDKRNQ